MPAPVLGKPVAPLFVSAEPLPAGWEQLGMVSGVAIYGTGLSADLSAMGRNLVGGRSKSLEDIASKAEKAVLDQMREKARAAGAQGLCSVSVRLDIDGGFILARGQGTAAKPE